MSERKHTALPWKACRSHEDYEGPYFEIDDDERAYYDSKPITSIMGPGDSSVAVAHDLFEFKPENAAFLVRAANNHYDLVARLEETQALLNELLAQLDIEASRLVVEQAQSNSIAIIKAKI